MRFEENEKKGLTFEDAGLTFQEYNELNNRISSFLKLTCNQVSYPEMKSTDMVSLWMDCVVQPQWILERSFEAKFVAYINQMMEDKKYWPADFIVVPGMCEFEKR